MADALQDWHPSEEELLRHVDGELSFRSSSRVLAHLEACWTCRARIDRLHDTIRAFTELVEGPLTADLPEPPHGWSGFAAALRRVANSSLPSSRPWSPLALKQMLRCRLDVLMALRLGPWAFWRTVLVGACVTLIVLAVVTLRSPTVSAAEILAAAERADHVLNESPGIASYRVLRLEARRQRGPALIARATVEVWHDGRSGLKARRLYDEHHTLVAGEWIDRNGLRTLYQRTGPVARSGTGATTNGPGISFEDAWRWEPSSADFIRLAGGTETTTVRRAGGRFVLSYRRSAHNNQRGLLEASLTVRHADWRTMEQTLVVQQASDVREYRVIEGHFERMPAARAASRFTPEPELLDLPAPPAPLADTRAVSGVLTPLPGAVAYPSPTELDQLELEACYRVHRFNLCLESPSAVIRTHGGVRVKAQVALDGQRALVLQALGPLASHQAMDVEIEARDDRGSSRGIPAEASVPRADHAASAGVVPAAGALRRYLHAQMGDRSQTLSRDTLDSTIATLSTWAIQRSTARLEEMRTVRQLLARWPPDRMQRLGPDTVAMWHAMLTQHARAFEAETERLRLQLQPILFPSLVVEQNAAGPGQEETVGLMRIADELWTAVNEEDRWIRQAFSASGERDAPPDWERLGRSLHGSQRLATRLSAPQVIAR